MNSPELTPPPLFRTRLQPPDFPLFDVHVNLGLSDTEGIGYGRLAAAEYVDAMQAAGVRWACVFPPLMADYSRANVQLRDWCRAQAPSLLPFARLGGAGGPRPIRQPWQARRHLRRWLQPTSEPPVDLAGYAGVKMIPHLSGLPGPATLAAIDEARLPVLVHAGTTSPPAWIEQQLFSQLRGPIIMAHLGAYPTDPDLLEDAVEIAAREPRVFLDTSGVWVSEFIRYAARRVPHKLLFASDAPLAHPSTAWLQLQSAIRDDAVLEDIAWRQAHDLFRPDR